MLFKSNKQCGLVVGPLGADNPLTQSNHLWWSLCEDGQKSNWSYRWLLLSVWFLDYLEHFGRLLIHAFTTLWFSECRLGDSVNGSESRRAFHSLNRCDTKLQNKMQVTNIMLVQCEQYLSFKEICDDSMVFMCGGSFLNTVCVSVCASRQGHRGVIGLLGPAPSLDTLAKTGLLNHPHISEQDGGPGIASPRPLCLLQPQTALPTAVQIPLPAAISLQPPGGPE